MYDSGQQLHFGTLDSLDYLGLGTTPAPSVMLSPNLNSIRLYSIGAAVGLILKVRPNCKPNH